MAARVAVTAPFSDDLAVIPNRDGSVNVVGFGGTFPITFLFSQTSGVGKAKISVATPGATTIVPAVPGKVIRVIGAYFVAGGAVNINWQSTITTSVADGVQDFAQNGGIVLGFNPIGWFDTVQGEGLDIFTSNGSQVGGNLIYATF
jgi:hypothetical protein